MRENRVTKLSLIRDESMHFEEHEVYVDYECGCRMLAIYTGSPTDTSLLLFSGQFTPTDEQHFIACRSEHILPRDANKLMLKSVNGTINYACPKCLSTQNVVRHLETTIQQTWNHQTQSWQTYYAGLGGMKLRCTACNDFFFQPAVDQDTWNNIRKSVRDMK